MKAGIVVFPGSNCDKDCFHALDQVLGIRTQYIWHDDYTIPQDIDLLVLPGGFSYGDYLRAGAIATYTHIMDQVKNYASKGKLLLGICNGFQVLTESHLLPGVLIRNENLRFICQDVYLKTINNQTAFTGRLQKNQVLKIPIAHGEGNYFIDEPALKELKQQQQIVFQYTDASGNANGETNPNGSVENIAGIINRTGNILGMMPHPERAIEQLLGSEDGREIFLSAVEFLKQT